MIACSPSSEKFNKRLRLFTGLGVLMVALITYLSTVEPTASYWDCPEYIAVAAGMQPGHPPGNPVWMLAARFFINFAPDTSYIALTVNIMSAVCAALTIYLLYLTIEWMGRHLLSKGYEEPLTHSRAVLSVGAGVTGALALCWSDTFWFSAVEAEVYSFSSLCTALLFWLALVWYDRRRQAHSDRLLILIAYLMGLSIGVHELNLLCLPAIGLIITFGIKERPGAARLILSLFLSLAAVALILYGLIPGFIKLAQLVELLCVNRFGMSFNSGLMICWFVVMVALIGGAVILAAKYRGWRRIGTLLMWSVAGLLLGFSSYAVIIIRAGANPPLNTNNPSDIFSFSYYFTREQYGKAPLFYGAPFTAPRLNERQWTKDAEGKAIPIDSRYRFIHPKRVYTRGEERMPLMPRTAFATPSDSLANAVAQRRGGDYYLISEYTFEQDYPSELKMFFPRMHSHAPEDVTGYYNWLGITEADLYSPGQVTSVVDSAGHSVSFTKAGSRPTYLQNLQYLTVYQCGFMYMRYFLWNFVGRQNDATGHGEPDVGNFITGIPVLDNAMLDNLQGAPCADGSSNPGHNRYFALPLILGILGLIAQLRRGIPGKRQALIIAMLFFLTGLAIVIYLNQGPVQARDRDYAFAGSWYAFAIWIGLGVIPLHSILKRFIRNGVAAACTASLLSLLIPLQMLSQTADDHDRSHRTPVADMARNTLLPMEKDAIFFASDDNSIFPAWYIQEVEGVRTDIRSISSPYLGSRWYIPQLLSPMRESSPVPLTLSHELLPLLRSPYVHITDADTTWTPALSALRRLYDTLSGVSKDAYPTLPTPRLYFTMGTDTVFIDMRKAENRSYCSIASLLTVDMLATSAALPEPRHFYWTSLGIPFVLGGQLMPYTEQIGNIAHLNPANPGLNAPLTAHHALHTYRYANAAHPSKPYFDPVAAHQLSLLRRSLLAAALQLSTQEDPAQTKQALALLQKIETELPASTIPYEAFYDVATSRNTDEGIIVAQVYLNLAKSLDPALQSKGITLLKQRREYLKSIAAFRENLRPTYRQFLSYPVERLYHALPLADSLLSTQLPR